MNKILGYLLICAGLLLILFSLMGMYKVFVNANPVVPVVQMADAQLVTSYGPVVVPMKSISAAVNLVFFALFMFFVLLAGAKVSSVGNGLVKNERIYEALTANAHAAEQADTLKKL